MPTDMSYEEKIKANKRYDERQVIQILIEKMGSKENLMSTIARACIGASLLSPRSTGSPESVDKAQVTVFSAVFEHELHLLAQWKSVRILAPGRKETFIDFGIDVSDKVLPLEAKATRKSNSPTIKKENIGNFILFVKYEEVYGQIEAGVIRVRDEMVTNGGRDGACELKRSFLKHIVWISRGFKVPRLLDSEISKIQRAFVEANVNEIMSRKI